MTQIKAAWALCLAYA